MVKDSFIDIQTFKQALSKRDNKVAEAFSYVSHDIGKLSAELDQQAKQTTKNEKSHARDIKLQLASIVKLQRENQRDLKKLTTRFEKFESKLNGHAKPEHFMKKSFGDLVQWVKKGSLETERPASTVPKTVPKKPKPALPKKKRVAKPSTKIKPSAPIKPIKPIKPAPVVPVQKQATKPKPKVIKVIPEPVVEEIDHEYLDRLQQRNTGDDSDPLNPIEERTFFEDISEGKDEEGKKRKWKVQHPKSDFDWFKEEKP